MVFKAQNQNFTSAAGVFIEGYAPLGSLLLLLASAGSEFQAAIRQKLMLHILVLI